MTDPTAPTSTPTAPGLADVHAQALAKNAAGEPVGPAAYKAAVDALRRAGGTEPDWPAIAEHLRRLRFNVQVAARDNQLTNHTDLGESLQQCQAALTAAQQAYGSPATTAGSRTAVTLPSLTPTPTDQQQAARTYAGITTPGTLAAAQTINVGDRAALLAMAVAAGRQELIATAVRSLVAHARAAADRRAQLAAAAGTEAGHGLPVAARAAADRHTATRRRLAELHVALRDGGPVDRTTSSGDLVPADDAIPEVWAQLAQLADNPRFLLADVFSDADLRARIAALAVAAVREADARAAAVTADDDAVRATPGTETGQ